MLLKVKSWITEMFEDSHNRINPHPENHKWTPPKLKNQYIFQEKEFCIDLRVKYIQNVIKVRQKEKD